MFISYEKMKEINAVQIQILKNVSEVCAKLDIPFYMVHGSLLGTVRNKGFVPGDDDIDIALFRADYETFLREAPKLLENHYFVQSNVSDENYPLEFAKVRDSRTTYIIESASHMQMHHGIYIDVFPIDYYPVLSKCRHMFYVFRYKLLKVRIRSVWKLPSVSVIKKLVGVAAKIYCPEVKKAVREIDDMLKSSKKSDLVRISGGKHREQGIPKIWFDDPCKEIFEGINVWIPNGYASYLTQIYGDYNTRTLLENKEVNEQGIEINACVVDTKKSYTYYTGKSYRRMHG